MLNHMYDNRSVKWTYAPWGYLYPIQDLIIAGEVLSKAFCVLYKLDEAQMFTITDSFAQQNFNKTIFCADLCT